MTCHIGGKTIIRHDAVVRGLAELLKPFVISCATEVYINAPAARGRAEAPAFFCKSFRRERVLLENRDFAEIVM